MDMDTYLLSLICWYMSGITLTASHEYFVYKENPDYKLTVGDLVFDLIFSFLGPLMIFAIVDYKTVIFERKK